MKPKKNWRQVATRIGMFIILNLIITVFVFWVSYSNRVTIKKWLDHSNNFDAEDKVIMYDIFSAPLLPAKDLLLSPVQNSDELIKYLERESLPDSLDLFDIYNRCELISSEKFGEDVLRIKYQLYGDTLTSYLYFYKMPQNNGRKAILYTSGTGDNRSFKVSHRLLDVEDPMNEALRINADIYFPIFPADGINAIHDGVKKLDIRKIANYMVSINRSMPLKYLANIFALQKYLKGKYKVLHSWGHSRGSITATITASVFHPDTLIANSGYAVSLEKFFRLGPDQMWWPHSSSFLNKDSIKKRFCGEKTKVFFLYGQQEEDIYGLETKYNYTKKYFEDCKNIEIRYGHGKHEWFSDEISKILGIK